MIENKTPDRLKAKYISSEFCISIPASKHKTLISMPVVAVERLGLGKCCIFLHLHASEDLRGCLCKSYCSEINFRRKAKWLGERERAEEPRKHGYINGRSNSAKTMLQQRRAVISSHTWTRTNSWRRRLYSFSGNVTACSAKGYPNTAVYSRRPYVFLVRCRTTQAS